MSAEPVEGRYTRRQVLDFLPLWGEWVAFGTVYRERSLRDATGVAINTGGKHGSKLPIPAAYLDVALAFANLNPATAGFGRDGNLSWLAHHKFNGRQQILWDYYVEVAQERPPAPKPKHTGNPAVDAGPFGEEEHQRREEAQERLKGRRPSEASLRALAQRRGQEPDAVESSLRRAVDALLDNINDLGR